MCVPASKESARREQWLRTFLVCAAAVVAGYWAAQRVVAYEISVLVEAETDFLLEGIIPCYAPSELRISAEAADDIEDLQRYVWLLAQHDLAASAAWPHTLDLASTEPSLSSIACSTSPRSCPRRKSMPMLFLLRRLLPGDSGCQAILLLCRVFLRSHTQPLHRLLRLHRPASHYGLPLLCAEAWRRRLEVEVATMATMAQIPRPAPPRFLLRRNDLLQFGVLGPRRVLQLKTPLLVALLRGVQLRQCGMSSLQRMLQHRDRVLL